MFISGDRIMDSRRRSDTASACQRVRGEYREMPCLRLTESQAARLLGLAPAVCHAVLVCLVADGFLGRTTDGRFVRRGACPRCE
jgi:hypothetical protein